MKLPLAPNFSFKLCAPSEDAFPEPAQVRWHPEFKPDNTVMIR